MPLQRQQTVSLCDRLGKTLGRVAIDRIEGDLVFGRFTPGPDYAGVERLFAEYVEAANDQLLSIVAELDAAIAALGLHLRPPEGAAIPDIYDVQIGSGLINFRIRAEILDGKAPEQSGAAHLPASGIRGS
jgi:hypothetical protein